MSLRSVFRRFSITSDDRRHIHTHEQIKCSPLQSPQNGTGCHQLYKALVKELEQSNVSIEDKCAILQRLLGSLEKNISTNTLVDPEEDEENNPSIDWVGDPRLFQSLYQTGLFTTDQIQAILTSQHLTKNEFEPNQVILTQQEVGQSLYVLMEGQVSIWQQQQCRQESDPLGTQLRKLSADQSYCPVFGERALLECSHQRTASVRSETMVVCVVIAHEALEEILRENQLLCGGFYIPLQSEETYATHLQYKTQRSLRTHLDPNHLPIPLETYLHSHELEDRFKMEISSLVIDLATIPHEMFHFIASSQAHVTVTLLYETKRFGRTDHEPCTVTISSTQVVRSSHQVEFYFLDSVMMPSWLKIAMLPLETHVSIDYKVFPGKPSRRSSLSMRRASLSSSSSISKIPIDTISEEDNNNRTTSSRAAIVSGSCRFYLFGANHMMEHGTLVLIPSSDEMEASRSRLHLSLPNVLTPVRHSYRPISIYDKQPIDSTHQMLAQQLLSTFRNPFHILTSVEKQQIWLVRHTLSTHFDALPWFLQVIDWFDQDMVTEAYTLLNLWKRPTHGEHAIRLLGPHTIDTRVRSYAVSILSELSPNDMLLYLLQLVHALRHERFDDSPLARFLISQALLYPTTIGQGLYWCLYVEASSSIRYALLLQTLVYHFHPSHRLQLYHQQTFLDHLYHIHERLQSQSSLKDKNAILRQELQRFTLPSSFVLPLDPTLVLDHLDISHCRVLDSKQKPLYLVFQTSQQEEYAVILKCGNDLRQDQLVLQLFQIMNRLWQHADVETELTVYSCVATTKTSGLIQVVRHAETIASIISTKTQEYYGSTRGTMHHKLHSAYEVLTEQKHTLREWLFRQQETSSISLLEQFTRSCAASCVATYVLGIGDRHNDNIMITRHGALFHIDFGHIFGHFKKKFGISRERTYFIFTPAFVSILEEHQDIRTFVKQLKETRQMDRRQRWQTSIHTSLRDITATNHATRFSERCARAYNVIRHHATFLYSLCQLLVQVVPELQQEEDLEWMEIQLRLYETDEQARQHFLKLLEQSLVSRTSQWNDAAHMLKHG